MYDIDKTPRLVGGFCYYLVYYHNPTIALIPYHNITPHTINLIPTHRRNPTSDHSAELNACFLLLVWRYSQTKAPMIGHTINPIGGKKNNHPINPIVEPHVPYLVPPNFLVPRCGIV